MRRQGSADRNVSEGHKVNVTSNAMNVKGVSQIGTSLGNHATDHKKILSNVPQPLHAGRGFMSPLGPRDQAGVGGGRTLHPKGSQGRR